jgi:predicted nucleic acid-binding protein
MGRNKWTDCVGTSGRIERNRQITVEYEQTERIMKDLLALARANNLSSYDASYLDLSMRKGFPIATLDSRLIEAAKKADVPIFMD